MRYYLDCLLSQGHVSDAQLDIGFCTRLLPKNTPEVPTFYILTASVLLVPYYFCYLKPRNFFQCLLSVGQVSALACMQNDSLSNDVSAVIKCYNSLEFL